MILCYIQLGAVFRLFPVSEIEYMLLITHLLKNLIARGLCDSELTFHACAVIT